MRTSRVDHHLLQVHNVRDDVADPAPWNIAFLALSIALVAAGFVCRSRARSTPGDSGT